MKLTLNTICIVILFLFTSNLFAQNYAVGLKAGARGIGVDVKRSFGEDLNIGLGFSYFGLAVDGGESTDDYEYSADAKLTSLNLFADWFPFESIFRLTGGIVINLNSADVTMTPTQTYTVGGDEYGPEKLGILSANVKYNPVAPYFGIGFGNPTQTESALSFTLDVGTFYQGGAIVDLSATKLLTPSAAPDQEEVLEENLSWFKWYPVLNIGINYRF